MFCRVNEKHIHINKTDAGIHLHSVSKWHCLAAVMWILVLSHSPPPFRRSIHVITRKKVRNSIVLTSHVLHSKPVRQVPVSDSGIQKSHSDSPTVTSGEKSRWENAPKSKILVRWSHCKTLWYVSKTSSLPTRYYLRVSRAHSQDTPFLWSNSGSHGETV